MEADEGERTVTRRRSDGPERTEQIAAEFARGLRAGDVVLLAGGLGTGKTTFVRGAARALGIQAPVTSPTFTIGQLYSGATPVAHLDLYRLAGGGGLEAEDPGLLDDYLTPGAIAFIEWPEVGAGLIEGVVAEIAISHAGGDSREILIEERRR